VQLFKDYPIVILGDIIFVEALCTKHLVSYKSYTPDVGFLVVGAAMCYTILQSNDFRG
jgi:hypothetical protein